MPEAGRGAPHNEDEVASRSRGGRFRCGVVLADRFEIVSLLGSGGMGDVYEANDRELREPVALKAIRHDALGDPETVERFRREVLLARRVTHPNVCRLHDIFKHVDPAGGETLFLTMELLRGEGLDQYLRRRGRISTAEALPLAEQMALGLDAAHASGVIHRDLKPSNIFLVGDSGHTARRLVITDFGLARSSAQTESVANSLTASHHIVGSPAYMSPEQVLSGEVTRATDVYAFGIVLFEMVTGRRPFEGDSPMAVALQRVNEGPPSPRTFIPDLPSEWDDVILRCLSRAPEARFANLAAAIEALHAPEGRSTRPVPASRKAPEGPATRGLARSRIRVATLVALFVLVGLWGLRQRTGRKPVPGRSSTSADVVFLVAPFLPLSSDARGEAETMQQVLFQQVSALVEGHRTIRVVMPASESAPRTEAEARTLGSKAKATVVLWGQVSSLKGQVVLEPRVTRLSERLFGGPMAHQPVGPSPLQVTGREPDQLSLRRAKARDTSALALAVVAEDIFRSIGPSESLNVLERVDTAESYYYRARALQQSVGALQAAIFLDSGLRRWPDSPLLLYERAVLNGSACWPPDPVKALLCDPARRIADLRRALAGDAAFIDVARLLAKSVELDPRERADILEHCIAAAVPDVSDWDLSLLASLYEWTDQEQKAAKTLQRINSPWKKSLDIRHKACTGIGAATELT